MIGASAGTISDLWSRVESEAECNVIGYRSFADWDAWRAAALWHQSATAKQ
ncbi:hypothetical protein BRAS3843_860037 [Bradyrhizobium sp. STM 3843]|nr:hypothetical protein BRAS3843_860037 [Bradyrhizobium sp. STM 3843]